MSPHQHWIVTADGRGAALYSCQRTPGGELHVEQLRSLENTHEGEHERHRPSMLGGAERRGTKDRSGARAAPHAVSLGHEVQEEQQRFARDIGAWLAQATKNIDGAHVSVFAPPRLLGLLRTELGAVGRTRGPNGLADFREGELAQLRPHELAVHPAVLSAVTGQPGAGPT